MQSSYDYRIKVKDLSLQRKCIVYGWWRESIFAYLYIGCSIRGLERIFTHDVLGKAEPFAVDDEVHIWQTTRVLMLKREEELIKFFKPKYNSQHIVPCIKRARPIKPAIVCDVCQLIFNPRNQESTCWPCKAKELKIESDIIQTFSKKQKPFRL